MFVVRSADWRWFRRAGMCSVRLNCSLGFRHRAPLLGLRLRRLVSHLIMIALEHACAPRGSVLLGVTRRNRNATQRRQASKKHSGPAEVAARPGAAVMMMAEGGVVGAGS